mgnify:FL=1
MQSLCTFDLCELAAQIIADECSTPNFTIEKPKIKDYENARYLYVYFCHNHINASFPIIRRTMLCYKYPKTVHQVFRRMYLRRKDNNLKMTLHYITKEYEERLKEFKAVDVKPRETGKQLCIFNFQ